MPGDSGGEQGIQPKLGAMVQEAEEWYAYLKNKHDNDTKNEAVMVGLLAFAATLFGTVFSYAFVYHMFVNVDVFFVAIITIPIAAGLITWVIRRRRRFPFAELGLLITTMKAGQASAEDGLRMADMMHDALLAMKKGKMDAAFSNGAVAFFLVAIFGLNVAVGLLTGVVVYLYFRFEALRDYENESRRYEESKKEFVESL